MVRTNRGLKKGQFYLVVELEWEGSVANGATASRGNQISNIIREFLLLNTYNCVNGLEAVCRNK